MKFEYWKENSKTYIRAIVENESEQTGFRAEGPFPKIEMVNNTIEFDYDTKEIHPDLLALLCIVCFYPYCKGDVTFPKDVSENFANAFGENGLKQKEVIDGSYTETNIINVLNIDKDLVPYRGSKISVSYGGGMDSTALYALFPEAIYVHEQTRLLNGEIVQDNSIQNIDFINSKGGTALSFANTNRRGISRPSGWAAWTACAANALLISTDYNIGYIFTGTVLGSAFLWNGTKYFPANERKNQWVETFNKIGIPLVQVTSGLTEISNAKILIENNLIDLPVWCNGNKGGNCHKCWKCFRRDTILEYLNYKNYDDEYWERYNTTDIINNLNKKPLYFGHIFKETLKNLEHINWISGLIDNIPESKDFVNSFHEPSLEIIPNELRNLVKNRITKYVPIDKKNTIKKWTQ